jgi:hypothetical protein
MHIAQQGTCGCGFYESLRANCYATSHVPNVIRNQKSAFLKENERKQKHSNYKSFIFYIDHYEKQRGKANQKKL